MIPNEVSKLQLFPMFYCLKEVLWLQNQALGILTTVFYVKKIKKIKNAMKNFIKAFNHRTLEPWKNGTMEPYLLEPGLGTLKTRNFGTLEPWKLGTLEPWNLGTLEP